MADGFHRQGAPARRAGPTSGANAPGKNAKNDFQAGERLEGTTYDFVFGSLGVLGVLAVVS
jgi:hypothetical protein